MNTKTQNYLWNLADRLESAGKITEAIKTRRQFWNLKRKASWNFTVLALN